MGKTTWAVVWVLTGIIRFALFVPFGTFASLAINHWSLIKKHVELQGPPYSPQLMQAARLNNYWAQFGFYWNFAVWVPGMFLPPPFSLPFTAVDITVTTQISRGLQLLDPHIPHTIGACKNGGAEQWQLVNGTNMTMSFFTLAAKLNATKSTPFKMCKSYGQEWQYGISLAVIYGFISFLSVFAWITTCASLEAKRRKHNQNWRTWFTDTLSVIPKGAILVGGVIAFIPVGIFRCLPIGVKSRTRYGRRYMVKVAQRVPPPKELAFKTFKPKKSPFVRYQNRGDGKATDLADFLCYDILLLVVEELDYVDVMNLAQVSKSVREAVLPTEDLQRRILHFKMYSCSAGTKTQCWVCTNQICEDCTFNRTIKNPVPHYHLNNCVPYCSKCYYAQVQHNRSFQKYTTPACQCAPLSKPPNYFQRVWKGESSYATRRNPPNVERLLCRSCNSLTDDEILEKRISRTKAELKDVKRGDQCKGPGCRTPLIKGSGPRWWVCLKCKKECRSSCHVSWGKDEKKEKDVGKPRFGNWGRERGRVGRGRDADEEAMVGAEMI